MSYTVLARKFRSRTFDEVVGQSAVTTTLKNAISQNRVHHGYLFCGTRGVGKTSVARILAKALNCLSAEGPTTTPCGTCDSCQMIARGEDMDVVEIDAASNTGVDHIRELRTNAVYRPTRSRFKVYIIDEVHMLSTGAFNALLKTLEEPPGHVKFIMATTESQKVPATILSRVQRFDFKSISPAEIAEQMTKICADEGIEAEPEALKRLARLANGSMRDGLSLLDQVISMAGRVSLQVVNEILPAAHDELFAALIDRLAEHDAAGVLAVADQSLSQGHALDHWCNLLISQIRDLMLMRLCGEQTDLVDVPAGLRSSLAEQCKKFDGGAYVYFISVLEELRRSVKSSGSGRPLVEAALVRMAEAANFSSIESLLAQVQGGASTHRPTPSSAPPPRIATSTPAAASPPVPPPSNAPPRTAPAPPMKKRDPIASAASPPVNPVTKRMTQADLKAAHAEPMVQAALEVFGGQIVHVQRDGADAPAPSTEH
ncbi:MAG TPA: DNA polymerase III subunit gamma/tau [Phycisphaerae bacterium]|nr:DNA polymerase III subunit gamma/tau [Phycisphaerae bacterium]